MTKKEIIEILLTYSTWNKRFLELNKELSEQIKQIDDTRDNISSALQNVGIPRGNNTGDPTFNKVDEIIQNLDKIKELTITKINNMLKEKEQIDRALQQLSFHERQVIEMYYFQNHGRFFKIRCARIGDKIGYSQRSVERIYAQAMRKLQEIM